MVHADEAVLGKRFDQVDRSVLLDARYLGGGVDVPAVDENGDGFQQRPLPFVEQADAPLHCGPQGVLAFGQVGAGRVPSAQSEVVSRRRSSSGSSSRARLAGGLALRRGGWRPGSPKGAIMPVPVRAKLAFGILIVKPSDLPRVAWVPSADERAFARRSDAVLSSDSA
jgi:hypothetical protein